MVNLKEKYCGSLLGTYVGDALGMPVEGYSPHAIISQFGRVDRMMEARLGKGTYTDDTEMMVATAESLITNKGFDGTHMALSFLSNFHPERGYGAGTIRALALIKSGVPWDKAGSMVFEEGSFGNGAAMRIAPIAVFYYDNIPLLRTFVERASLITHAHLLGKEGAILQAHTIALALQLNPQDLFAPLSFLQRLIALAAPHATIYREKLALIATLLSKTDELETVTTQLGNDSSAPNSVPTALYCFLTHPPTLFKKQ